MEEETGSFSFFFEAFFWGGGGVWFDTRFQDLLG